MAPALPTHVSYYRVRAVMWTPTLSLWSTIGIATELNDGGEKSGMLRVINRVTAVAHPLIDLSSGCTSRLAAVAVSALEGRP